MYRGVCVFVSGSEERTIQRIRTGAHRIYNEQYAIGAFSVFGFIAVVSLLVVADSLLPYFLIYGYLPQLWQDPIVGLMSLIGVCTLILSIIPYLCFWKIKKTYAYLGLSRSQLALAITSIDLFSHGHKCIAPVRNATYPHEYERLPSSMLVEAGRFLKRLKMSGLDVMMSGQDVDTERLTTWLIGVGDLSRYSINSVPVFIVGMFFTFLGLLGLGLFSFLASPGLILSVVLLIAGITLLLVFKHMAKSLRGLRTEFTDSTSLSGMDMDGAVRTDFVEKLLALLRSSYDHPLRILVLERHYVDLEYTGRTCCTRDCKTREIIELREAILLPGRIYT